MPIMHSFSLDVSRCRIGGCSTHITRECMKESAVFIVLKAFIKLMFPKYTAGAYKVDEAEEMGTSGTVRNQYEGALQATI
jgi:hypothetical protein